jgi:hypothetical protein
LAAKTIKECVEAVKKNREKGGMEEKESEAVEKSHHPSESSHNIHTEEHGKSVAEEPSDPSHGRSAVASQSSRSQGQSFHQQPQSTQQAQSQQQQQRNEPESQEVRSRQNSTNEELAAQQAKATVSNKAHAILVLWHSLPPSPSTALSRSVNDHSLLPEEGPWVGVKLKVLITH